jgi:hypothetical protein
MPKSLKGKPMDWSDIGSFVGKAAPLLGDVLTGNIPGAAVEAGSLIASALGCDATPAAVNTALLANPDAQVKLAQIEADRTLRLQELANQSAAAAQQAELAPTLETNATMRVEDGTGRGYWRDFVGYCFGVAFAVVTLLCCVLAWRALDTRDMTILAQIPVIVGSFIPLFGVPAGVLGVVAHHAGKVSQIKAGAA